MRNTLSTALVLAIASLAGCDSLNDAVPPISISGGIFGLDGTSGKELSGSFASASKTGAVLATGHFTVEDTFNDADAGDFADLKELVSNLGVAVESGNVGMRLYNTGGGSYPASVTATSWMLDFSISDASGSVGPPEFLGSTAFVTFSRGASCSDASPECAYTVSAGSVDQLADLFPISVEDEDYLSELADIVFMTGGESNTVNTLFLELTVEVTNATAEFQGLEGSFRVGEYGTQVTPVIF